MPKSVSKAQWRMMMAIIHGKRDHSKVARGAPPASIASQYSAPDKGAPENKGGPQRGGHWDEGAHKKQARLETKRSIKDEKEKEQQLKEHKEEKKRARVEGNKKKKETASKMKKSESTEELEKNIIRGPMGGGATLEVTHGDALKLVGNGVFRWLRDSVRGMEDEGIKDIPIDQYVVSIRKHINDIYSGRVLNGHKIVHQFTHKSLPQLTAELMSVFEWYLPEDELELQLLDDSKLSDLDIAGGLKQLTDDYKRHNIAEIYQEIEHIRKDIRNNMAVDLQQVEQRMMKLFDKLEGRIQELSGQHNRLTGDAGKDIDELEGKLRELQAKLEELGKKPVTVEAYSANPARPEPILENEYCYLSKPQIEIAPSGHIKITFKEDWNYMDRENFLKDMRARALKKQNG